MHHDFVGGEAEADGLDTGDADCSLYCGFLDVVEVAAGQDDAALLGFVLSVYF